MCNAIQYNTIQYNTNTIQYNTIQIKYNTIQYNTNTNTNTNTIQYNTNNFIANQGTLSSCIINYNDCVCTKEKYAKGNKQ